MPGFQPARKFVQRDFERLRPKFVDTLRNARSILDAPKLSSVFVSEYAAVERQNRMGPLRPRSIELQPPGHPEVDGKYSVVQPYRYKFSVTIDAANLLPGDRGGCFLRRSDEHAPCAKLRIQNTPACQMWTQAPDHGFDFRQFRHAPNPLRADPPESDSVPASPDTS